MQAASLPLDSQCGYLLIESRDPFESNDVHYYYELASEL
jgi:hypothetical protein